MSFSCYLSSNALTIISKLFRISEPVTINCPISLTEKPRTSQSEVGKLSMHFSTRCHSVSAVTSSSMWANNSPWSHSLSRWLRPKYEKSEKISLLIIFLTLKSLEVSLKLSRFASIIVTLKFKDNQCCITLQSYQQLLKNSCFKLTSWGCENLANIFATEIIKLTRL